MATTALNAAVMAAGSCGLAASAAARTWSCACSCRVSAAQVGGVGGAAGRHPLARSCATVTWAAAIAAWAAGTSGGVAASAVAAACSCVES